ncbi:MAG TPA: carbamoyltransferase, partial [Stellaceae bacterium]|nr:carbamoyltransferase [Stellaceae bacterium]
MPGRPARIVGISAFYHDSAAALVEDGRVIAAAQEERFTREKHDASFPHHALSYCLDEAGASLDEIDWVVFYDKPVRKFERLLQTFLAFAPHGHEAFSRALPSWLGGKLFHKSLLLRGMAALGRGTMTADRLLFAEHHLSHAASAYYPSPFERALILTLDGVGEWATTSVALGDGRDISVVKEIRFPHSLGLLYSAFTSYTGFKVNSGEYKVMGLAPYGEPRFAQRILDNLIDLKPDGSFHLDLGYFDYCTGFSMTNQRFHDLFEGPPRSPETWLTQREMDLAASIQAVTEEVVMRLTRSLREETGARNLCLAGGVALNCVANGKVLREAGFDDIWIQPAAGDAGGAIGAALCGHHLYCEQPRQPTNGLDGMSGAYLGPAFDDDTIAERLTAAGARFERVSDDALISGTADALADGQAVGWFQGRMEFGPRALGNRSILGDPRSPIMQKTLNLKVKYRESFRPFAPSVLREDVAEWFDLDRDSPYMLLVASVAREHCREMSPDEQQLFGIDKLNVARSAIPAVTHVDYSARIQTVHRESNPRYHELIRRFKAKTGCPVLVNTSFNVRGEPIVATPEDAFRCFMGTELDLLAIGNCVLRKADQPESLRLDYR